MALSNLVTFSYRQSISFQSDTLGPVILIPLFSFSDVMNAGWLILERPI